MRERDALGREGVDETQHLARRLAIRLELGDLRADVDVDAVYGDARQRGGVAVERRRVGERDAELALLQSRRDVRMRLRIDVGIHAEAHRGDLSHAGGNGRQVRELARRFDVEAEDAGRERRLHLRFGLADAGEDDLARITADSDHAGELSCGDDVEAAALSCKKIEDGEVGVRFHRVADQVRNRRECRVEGAIRAFQHRLRVDEQGCSEALGERFERRIFCRERAVRVPESARLTLNFALRAAV